MIYCQQIPQPMQVAEQRREQAWEALARKDWDEFDKLTGFVMKKGGAPETGRLPSAPSLSRSAPSLGSRPYGLQSTIEGDTQ